MRAPRSRWRTWSVSGATVRPADLLLQALGCALRLVLRLSPALAKLVDACLLGLSEIEPVDRLGKAEVRVDAGDHDPRIDRDQLDPDHRDTHVRIDHETLVEDQIDHVRQPARTRSPLQVVARRSLGRYRHGAECSSCCRFGNALASAAALAPLFARLLALLALLLTVIVGLLVASRGLVGVVAVLLLLLVLGIRPVLDALRVLHLDVGLEASEIGLDGSLHKAKPGRHLLHHPVGLELHVHHHAGEVVRELVEADDPLVLHSAVRLPDDAVVLAPLGDAPLPLAAAEPDLLAPTDLVAALLLHVEHAVHESRKLVELRELLVDLVDRKPDVGPALDREASRLLATATATAAAAAHQLRRNLPGRACASEAFLRALDRLLAHLLSLFFALLLGRTDDLPDQIGPLRGCERTDSAHGGRSQGLLRR